MPANEFFGWAWVLVGFVSGMLLGLRFQEDDWMGGYGSLRRRVVRLGHISFVGLGILNVLFALSGPRVHLSPASLAATSVLFILGGIAMPASCFLMAWRPALKPVFAVPVLALTAAAAFTISGLARP